MVIGLLWAFSAAQADPVLKAGSESDFPPFSSLDEDGHVQGFAVDLLTRVAAREGLQVSFRDGNWVDLRAALESGEIDVLPFMAVSPARRLKVDFGRTHLEEFDGVFVRAVGMAPARIDDLRGKKVFVREKDFSDDYFTEHNPGFTLVRTKTLVEALERLSAGEGDAIIGAEVSALHTLTHEAIENVSMAFRVPDYSRKFAFAVKKGHRDLVKKLDRGLEAVRASGEYEAIYDKWFASIRPEQKRAQRSARILFWFLVVVSVAFVGGVIWWWTLKLEVRRQERSLRQTTLELRQSEANYQQILDAIPDMILVKGAHSKIFWANRAFTRFYGMSNEELRDIIDAPFNKPDYTQQYIRDDAHVFNTGEQLDIPSEPATRFDGEVRRFHTVKSPIFDASGRVILTLGISRDITERIRTEEVLEKQRQSLVNASRMSALGEMAGGIAHEINNPLAVITALSEKLSEKARLAPQIESSLVVETAGKIESTASRIGKIVRSLRTISRDGQSDPFFSVRLSEIIDDTLELCQARFRHHGVALRCAKIPADLTLKCRPVQIAQVLLNLLNNAFDAVVGTPHPWISLTVVEGAEWLELRVADSGPGIPAAIQDRIMEPFFTTKEVGKGTGLGLSVSRSLAEGHGGQLFLQTGAENTEFVLRLAVR